MNNLLCIVGPTATGKTRLAEEIKLKIEHRNNRTIERSGKVELISIDSRQIYIGMNIGTGKDAKIFGTDLTPPDKLFNVSDFVKIIRPKIEKLWQKNILPILIGGSGLYLRAIIDGIETMEIPPDEKLRKKYEKYSVEKLQEQLRITNYELRIKNLDHNFGMNNSDWMNPRRLIRRIEILTNTNKYYPILTNTNKLKIEKLAMVGLTASLPQITKNIEKRVQERLDRGLFEEIKGLVKEFGWNEVLKNTIAYKEWEDYFSEKITKNQAISNWTHDEIDYAKRQMTWFKKDKRIQWLDITHHDLLQKSLDLIQISNNCSIASLFHC
jgi:tRNA dimethylallyltransferase